MSNWTHVAGIVRIDSFRLFESKEMNFDEIFGKEIHFDDSYEDWKDARMHPGKYLPLGSEGSLTKTVWINPDESHLAAYTVSVFGDLRDHQSSDAIIEWFKDICSRLNVRNATISAYNEQNGDASWCCEG